MDIDVFPNIFYFWGPSGMMFLRDPQIAMAIPYNYEGWKFAVALEVPQAAAASFSRSPVSNKTLTTSPTG